MDIVLIISILVMSVVIHEVSHGYVAGLLGDPTAKLAGRLSLNPIKHIDPVGSILVPLILVILPTNFILGWARPVPYNPYNLKWGKYGPAIVAAAGPAANLLIAFLFGLVFRFNIFASLLSESAIEAASLVIFINIIIGLFNLMPFPPLDGSKILFAVLPYRFRGIEIFMTRYQLFLLLFFILFAGSIFIPLVSLLAYLATGVPIF